jgi:hypothetical protein
MNKSAAFCLMREAAKLSALGEAYIIGLKGGRPGLL